MELLVKRDKNHLVKTEGKAEVDSDVPEILREPRVVPQSFVKSLEKRDFQDDLLISDKKDYGQIEEHLLNTNNGLPPDAIPGIWSGYRSSLIKDPESGRLFRLKGVSLDPKNPVIQDLSDTEYQVFGGQLRPSARFEQQMSDKFNEVLAKEGIIPIMTFKGYWHYPDEIKGNEYSGSVIEVEGDTRLDEIMLILENFFAYRIGTNNRIRTKDGSQTFEVNDKGAYVGKRIFQLYQDIGFITGRLKRLMDKNNQTWSADKGRTNAHIGNIVLYNGSEEVKVGFVDFDASCDTDDFPRSKIRRMQETEFETIYKSAYSQPISLRQIQARFLNRDLNIFSEFRNSFAEGFAKGYEKRVGFLSPAITNTLPFERFLEIFDILRSGERLSPEAVRSSLGSGKRKKESIDYFNPYGILKKNKSFQEDLLGKGNYIEKHKGLEDYLENTKLQNNYKGLDRYLYI